MPMAIVVTRNAEGRFRGFLSSIMVEIAPGVYVANNMNARIRDRTWEVLKKWHEGLFEPNRSIILAHADKKEPSGIKILSLGEPIKEVLDIDGIFIGFLSQKIPENEI